MTKIALALAGLLSLLGVYVWADAVSAVYCRERDQFARPFEGIVLPPDHLPSGFRDVTFHVPGGASQHAWYLPPKGGALITYAHGSPGRHEQLLPEAHALAKWGHGALLLDLPGYGQSQGPRRWDAGFVTAVHSAVSWARSQPEVDPERIVGFGYSMGTSIMALAAVDDPSFRALILRSPFTRLRAQLNAQYASAWPLMPQAAITAVERAGIPIDWLDTERAVTHLQGRPMLIVAAANDGLCPPWMARELFHVASRAELWIGGGADHVNLPERLGATYFARLAQFLAHATRRS